MENLRYKMQFDTIFIQNHGFGGSWFLYGSWNILCNYKALTRGRTNLDTQPKICHVTKRHQPL